MITLGGNIKLEGFESLEPGMLVVVKKIAGFFAKSMAGNIEGIESFEVTRTDAGVSISVKNSGKNFSGTATDKNIFMAMSNAMKQVEGQIRQ